MQLPKTARTALGNCMRVLGTGLHQCT